MGLFVFGILLLVIGYLTYGRFLERLLGPDDRDTPALAKADGVDYVILPQWKNMLIQLLNIAGIGPVIGVILGIKFGEIVFVILPIGNVIGGAVHDFCSGMMSLRNGGANLPSLISKMLGNVTGRIFSWFMVILLLLVVAVFINIPAQLLSSNVQQIVTGAAAQPEAGAFLRWCAEQNFFWVFAILIFGYYVLATLFPVDKIIGRVYPIFGAVLLISTLILGGVLLWQAWRDPQLLVETGAFREGMFRQPVIPMLFVTIACGILSGFHATQSPIVARTMRSERQARSTFYGMMIVEGIIGMIWAAGGMAIYNLYPQYMQLAPALVLEHLTKYFLGSWIGGFTVLGVVVLAVTSGDTALRSLRLSLAEMLHCDQVRISRRLLITLPLVAVVALLLWWSNQNARTFNYLWNYFAWGNQVLAVFTLLAAAVWMKEQRLSPLPALLPGAFICFVVLTYILWVSPPAGPLGLGLPLKYAYLYAGAFTLALTMMALIRREQNK